MLNFIEKQKHSSNEEGFTLIELMIVVVIIGILAAIAIPIFMNNQKEAIKAGMKQDVRSLQTIVATYLVKNPTATNLQWRFGGGQQQPGKALNEDADWQRLVTGFNTSDPATIILIRQSKSSANEVPGTWDDYTVLAANKEASPNSANYVYYYSSTTGKVAEENG